MDAEAIDRQMAIVDAWAEEVLPAIVEDENGVVDTPRRRASFNEYLGEKLILEEITQEDYDTLYIRIPENEQ